MTEKPPHIEKWVREGAKKKLSNAGKKGAKKKAERADVFAHVKQEELLKRKAEDREMMRSANYHILDPDGKPTDPDERPLEE